MRSAAPLRADKRVSNPTFYETKSEAMSSAHPPNNIISLVGASGSGKTELICRLIAWFKSQGLKVAVLKHSHKTNLAESDCARSYRQAGAHAVAQAGPRLVQITRYVPGEPDLAEVLAGLAPQADLVIVEGYKQSPLPKILVMEPRAEPITVDKAQIIALVSREFVESPLPVFHPDEVEEMGTFMLQYLRRVKVQPEP